MNHEEGNAPRGIAIGLLISIHLWVLGIILIALFMVTTGHCQTVICVGHSDCRSQYQYVSRDFPEIKHWISHGHDTERCARFTESEDVDLTKGIDGLIPDAIEVIGGTTDVELQGNPRNFTPRNEYLDCMVAYITRAHEIWPGALIVVPNIPGFNIAVLGPPASYDYGIAQRVLNWNVAEGGPVNGIAARLENPQWLKTVDIFTPLDMPNGWAKAWLNPYIDPNGEGWSAADEWIRIVLDAGLGL